MTSKVFKGEHSITIDGIKYKVNNVEYNMTDKTGIIVDDLTKTESSNVASVAYQNSSKKAFVTFKNGGLYEYKDVDKEDFEALRDAESVGRHLSAIFLKKGYDYEKLENTELLFPVLTGELLEEVKKKVEDDFGKI